MAIGLAAAAVLLTGLNLIAVILDYSTPRVFFATEFVNLFSTRREMNIPTWYSSFALLLCSLLLAIIAFGERKQAGRRLLQWSFLSLIFLYIAVDEGAAIHERLSQAASHVISLRGTGLFNYAWVVPAGLLVVLLGLAYLRFLLGLPTRTRNLFVLAGVTYIGGALGSEMVSGLRSEVFGADIGYEMISTVEELLEMSGVVIFVYALLDYMRIRALAVHLRVTGRAKPQVEARLHLPG
ncbi:MAG: hypothetical protein AABM32_02470 [Chloroflexota bacterium]